MFSLSPGKGLSRHRSFPALGNDFVLGDMSVPFKSKRVQVEVNMLIFKRADLKEIRTLKMETLKVRDMSKAWVSLSHSCKSYLEL